MGNLSESVSKYNSNFKENRILTQFKLKKKNFESTNNLLNNWKILT